MRPFCFAQRPPSRWGRSFFQHTVDDAEEHQHVILIQLAHPLQGLLDQLRVLGGLVEKLLGGDFQIVTDGKELLHGRQGFSGGDVVNVSTAVAQVIAHLVFGDALFQPQLCNAVPHKVFLHSYHPMRLMIPGQFAEIVEKYLSDILVQSKNICYYNKKYVVKHIFHDLRQMDRIRRKGYGN